MSAAGFFFITWGINSLNLPADWFPPSYVGTVLGFSRTGNGLGTLIVIRANRLGAGRHRQLRHRVPRSQLVLTLVGGPIHRLKINQPNAARTQPVN